MHISNICFKMNYELCNAVEPHTCVHIRMHSGTHTHSLNLEAAHSTQYCDGRALGQTLGQWEGEGSD